MSDASHEIQIALKDFDVSQLPENQRDLEGEALKLAIRDHLQEEFLGAKGASEIVVAGEHIVIRWAAGSTNVSVTDRAVDLLSQGDYTQGMKLLEAALLANPDDEVALYNLGMALSDQGRLDEAVVRIRHLLELDPDHSNGWVALGVAEARMGNVSGAIKSLSSAVDLDPENGYALRNLGAMEIEKEGLERQAEKHLQLAAKILPEDQQVWVNLGRLHENGNALKEADAAYLKVLDIDPTNEIARMAEEGRSRIAESVFRERGGQSRPDATLYCLGALQRFAGKSPQEIQKVTFEIATLGMGGLDINDPAEKYSVGSLPGNYSGLHLLSIEYVGFQLLDPSVDLGIDLSEEYRRAKQLFAEGTEG